MFVFTPLAMASAAWAQGNEAAPTATIPPVIDTPPPAQPFMSGGENGEALLELQELLDTRVVGVLTTTRDDSVPASVTIITEEDIRLTPHRNIYDLLEVYVPGALVMNHHEGPHPGIRGIISDRNYKLLLLVDGKVMNMRAHNGATSELENWDLGDISEIRVVRGPGSVTYGAGAIMGVISITTKRAHGRHTDVGLSGMSKYDSTTVRLSRSQEGALYKLFLYGSVTKTQGIRPKAYFGETASRTSGFIGSDFPETSPNSNPPQTYMSDYHGQPQLKLQATLELLKELELRFRYTTSGSPLNGSWPQLAMEPGAELTNLYERRQRQALLSLEDNHQFNPNFNLRTMLSFSTADYDKGAQVVFAGQPDPENGANLSYAFREDEAMITTVANWRFLQKYEAALGGQYSYEFYGKGWGDSLRRLRLGDGRDIVANEDSEGSVNLGTNVFGTKATPGTFVGRGWRNNVGALFGELNLPFHERLTVVASGRADFTSYTRPFFSPRLALISDMQNYGMLKLIGQLAYRNNTAAQLYQQVALGSKPDPERLVGSELIYSKRFLDNFFFDTSVYYNEINVVGWNNRLFSSSAVGKLKLGGTDLELRYNSGSANVSLNHSFTRQFSWKLADGVPSSGISYADYNLTTADGVQLNGFGNHLNNWSNNTTKLAANWKLDAFSDKVTVHFDARIFWDYAGAEDGLEMIKRSVVDTDAGTTAEVAIRRIEAQKAYQIDLRSNIGVMYVPVSELSITGYVMNLIGTNNNKRYAYDAGVSGSFPHRAAWVEEPRTVGVDIAYRY